VTETGAARRGKFVVRNARTSDMPIVRGMVRREGLDPTQLRQENFIVAETVHDLQRRIIGCAQLRQFPGAQELGSLIVEPHWRGQGVGSTLVRALLAGATGDVYLECAAGLASYYRPFGFRPISWRRLPTALKVKFGLGRVMSLLPGINIVAMHRPVDHRR
jgi:amino-acid N-acetyltransferase